MNWQELIKDLEESGLTQSEIGQLSGCSQSMVSDLKTGNRGKRLGFEIGTRLRNLWAERCNPQPEKIAVSK